MTTLNIYQRINEVRKKVDYIRKDAKVEGYKAVTHDAVTSELRPQLIEQGVIVVPRLISSVFKPSGSTTAKGLPWMLYEGWYEVDFVNMDSPDERVIVPIESHALDYGDKAPGKAASYATKYAMLKLFSIETGESDEGRQEQKPEGGAAAERAFNLGQAIERHKDTIECVKENIATGNLSIAAEAWYELTHDEMKSLWVAPTKGGPFTTEERRIMQTKEFREAKWGENDEPAELP
jgi:hypothetical protein